MMSYPGLQFLCLCPPKRVAAPDILQEVPKHLNVLVVTVLQILFKFLNCGWVLYKKFIVMGEKIALQVVEVSIRRIKHEEKEH